MFRTMMVALALGLGGLHAEPAQAQQGTEWVEQKLIGADEVEILLGGADACLQQGKQDCGRLMLLAAGPGLQEVLQRLVIPRNRQLVQTYDRLAPAAYSGHSPGPLASALSAHEADLVVLGEQQALPPVGPRFESRKERVQRVLAAKEGLEAAKDALVAYTEVAPDVTKHMETTTARAVLMASRSIVFSAITMPDHLRLATDIATTDAAGIRTQLDGALSAENLTQIASLASAEQDYANYLDQLGLAELSADHGAHAEHAFAEAKRIYAERIASNRIPAEQYGGGDKESLRAMVKQQFVEMYPGSKVLAVRLSGSGFATQWEWVRTTNGWAWRKVRRLQFVYVAYQGASESGDTCHVFPMRIEQTSAGGAFGSYFIYRPAQYFPFDMLVENI